MDATVEAIASEMVDRFNIEMDIYKVSQNCMVALSRMGMLVMGKKALAGRAVEQQLRMPVDTYDVKAVLRVPSQGLGFNNGMTITIQDIWFPNQKIFVPIPNSDSETTLLELPDQIVNAIPHLKGPYIDYTWDRPFVKFNEVSPEVIILYSTIPINRETGLANIPVQAKEACLYHCLYTYMEPQFLLGKVQPFVWTEVKEWRRRNFGQAEHSFGMSKLSQNEMSKVLDIMSSFDRKRTNIDS